MTRQLRPTPDAYSWIDQIADQNSMADMCEAGGYEARL